MALKHRRFALRSVTFAGMAMPGATIDCWQDSGGIARWSARVVTRSLPDVEKGELAGQMADGRLVSGAVQVTEKQVGPGGRRETLVVLSGSGKLNGFDE